MPWLISISSNGAAFRSQSGFFESRRTRWQTIGKSVHENPSIQLPTTSIRLIGRILKAASFCSGWSMIFRPTSGPLSSNVSSKRKAFATSQRNLEGPRAQSSSSSSGPLRLCAARAAQAREGAAPKKRRAVAMSKQPLIDQLDQAIGRMLANPDAMPLSVDPEVVELLRMARELRDLPGSDFKANLKADLERKAIMMSTKTVVMRPGFRTITPYLLPQGVEFIDFLKRVFDAEETFHAEAGPGRFHAEVRIGDSMLMVGGGSGRKMPAAIELYVPNVDEVYKRAIDAGCVELQPVQDAHWEPIRFGSVQDQAGNIWSIVTH